MKNTKTVRPLPVIFFILTVMMILNPAKPTQVLADSTVLESAAVYVDAPIAGAVATTTATDNDEHYTSEVIGWFEDNLKTQNLLAENGGAGINGNVFTVDKEYTLMVKLTAAEGYTWSATPNVTITYTDFANNHNVVATKQNIDGNTALFYIVVPCYTLRNLSVSITEPEIRNLPKYDATKNGTGYIASIKGWSKTVGDGTVEMLQSQKYEPGTYTARIRVQAAN
ncbi:MAG: hypothetical protein IKQ56_04165, partial [Lachnospiraceae bacterium]|nr:hypothetical protein [Lachnospiraceae bacterium]